MKKILLILFILGAFFQFACKKNSNSGPPVVTDVRTPDPNLKDSTFMQALPGTLIVIQGHGFGGLQAVYFNDTSAYFNPVYATDNNIIISIPSSAQTAATNPSVPSTIRIVTNHGTTTYSFSLVLKAPYISALSLDSTGTVLTITGGNFLGIKKITFPVPGNDTALSYTVDTSHSTIIARVPPGTPSKDSVRVYCTFGVGSFPYPPPSMIASVNNENAAGGTTLTINGTNFIGITDVKFPGGVSGTNLQVSINKITVTVPSGLTSGDTLRVVGAGGTSASGFVFDNWMSPAPGFQANFDGTSSQWSPPGSANPYFGWDQGQQWIPKFVAPGTGMANSTGGYVELNPQGVYAPGEAWYQDNLSVTTDSGMVWTANPSTDPIGNYALKFECSVQNWKAGAIWIGNLIPGTNYNWTYCANFEPWKTAPGGTWSTNGWQTVTIPLISFVTSQYSLYQTTGTPATKISQIMGSDGHGKLMFVYANDGTTNIPGGTFDMSIDNIRIVRIK
ncbi:MAG TPA: glycan-binding surface protein [Puia sp.]|nr:glycan-binding surface protein [Puia sp.]